MQAAARLELLQWKRARNLIADQGAVQDIRVFLAEGECQDGLKPAAVELANYSATLWNYKPF